MCFDRAPRDVQLLADFFVVASLQQELGNLLLTRSQPDKIFAHAIPPSDPTPTNQSQRPPGRQFL
jgi:hypothetical protein